MSAPANVKALRRAVGEAAARRAVVPGRMQYTVASTIALQMVPAGAAKGGGAIRHRVSETEARLTTDLDFARATEMELDTFVDAYSDQLQMGWAGFTGVLKAEKSKRPDDVPVEYLMDRFSIKLRYLGQPGRERAAGRSVKSCAPATVAGTVVMKGAYDARDLEHAHNR